MNTENINIEDIKVGEMYNVRVKVSRINAAGVFCYACDKDVTYLGKHPNLFTEDEVEAFFPITPENGTKNTASAPKYDPCRLFKKGDIVEPSEINGRLPQALRGCYRYEVIVGEGEMTSPLYVTVKPLLEVNGKHLSEIHVNAAFLKLVTPVEELEPYSIDPKNTNVLFKYGKKFATFEDDDEAQELRDRLNAEHRKEQK